MARCTILPGQAGEEDNYSKLRLMHASFPNHILNVNMLDVTFERCSEKPHIFANNISDLILLSFTSRNLTRKDHRSTWRQTSKLMSDAY